MPTIGYNHGRFQPLHNGHFNTFLKILENYDELWIGIANPLRKPILNIKRLDKDLQTTLKKARDPKNNPYSFLERYEMVRLSLIGGGIDMNRVRILPHFAFYECDNWQDFIPKEATIVLSSKDYHHYTKIDLYKKNGWKVDFVEPLPGISGTILREKFPDGNWQNLVPQGTVTILESKLKKQ